MLSATLPFRTICTVVRQKPALLFILLGCLATCAFAQQDDVSLQSFGPEFSWWPKWRGYPGPHVSVTPFAGYNVSDGLMPGVAVITGHIPKQGIKILAAPVYGLESKKWRGHGEIRYTGDVHLGPFDGLFLSAGLERFGYNIDTHYVYRDWYTRWSPVLALRLKPVDQAHRPASWVAYRYMHVLQDYGRGISYENYTYAREKRSYGVHELSWRLSSDHDEKPWSAKASMQAGQGFLRINARYKQHFAGRSPQHGVWVHGYGGWLPFFETPKANVVFNFSGIASNDFHAKDYMYDEWLGGRNATSGLFSRQVFIRDAGLKTLSNAGLSDNWMLSGGISAALPLTMIHLYMDAALYPSDITQEPKTQLSYSGGIALVLLKDIFEIYIPVVESRDILESITYLVRDRWFERVSFQANVKMFHPLDMIDRHDLWK